MAKYIDADALLDELSMSFSDMNTNVYDSQDDALEDAAVTVRQAVYGAPAADVAPVRHGKWHLHDGGKAAECSLCSHVERVRGRSLAKDEWRKYSPFCRLCGAKMDGGATHE